MKQVNHVWEQQLPSLSIDDFLLAPKVLRMGHFLFSAECCLCSLFSVLRHGEACKLELNLRKEVLSKQGLTLVGTHRCMGGVLLHATYPFLSILLFLFLCFIISIFCIFVSFCLCFLGLLLF